MSPIRIFLLTLITMLAFAGNSVLCRLALRATEIDAASFTSIRLISGAVVLGLIASFFRRNNAREGNWPSAFALFAYAACFSFAYISLTAATGALLLFGAVQATMIGHGLLSGEQLRGQQVIGLVLALAGLVYLMLPGLSAPPLGGSLLMLISGVAWGVYSLRGKSAADPICASSGNFIRASLFTLLLSGVYLFSKDSGMKIDLVGIAYAIASGALASGLGYALWYSVLPSLKATNAATIQLSVPVITAFGGILFLGESLTLRFALASLAILGGIALVFISKNEQSG